MTTTRFKELDYRQPSVSVAASAKRATTIASDILSSIPAALPFVMQPSALLLFAQQRAESPYHSFADALTKDEISTFDAVLAKYDIYRLTERLPANSAYPNEEIFSLIDTKTLNSLPNSYEFLKPIWQPIDTTQPFRQAYFEWVIVIERALASTMDEGRLPAEWLKDWWAPHNLRFGTLLGYPGEAISSLLWAEAADRSDQKSFGALEEVLVAKDEQYFGAQVAFYVHSDVMESTQVLEVTQAWKNVLEQIYDAFKFTDLMKNDYFAKSYHKLEKDYQGG